MVGVNIDLDDEQNAKVRIVAAKLKLSTKKETVEKMIDLFDEDINKLFENPKK